MDLYEFVHVVAERADLRLSQCDKEKIVGTLRAAGFSETLTTQRDKEQAMAVTARMLDRVRAGLMTRTAAAAKTGSELFKSIKDLNEAGKCGKCKGATETVKLANNEEANYCSSCRATLWKK